MHRANFVWIAILAGLFLFGLASDAQAQSGTVAQPPQSIWIWGPPVGDGPHMIRRSGATQSTWTWTPPVSAERSAMSAAPQAGLSPDASSAQVPPNCRYGASTAGTTQANWLATLGAGWYLDFGTNAPLPLSGAQYVQMLRIKQDKIGCTYLNSYKVSPELTNAALGAVVASHPGALWIVGNEPDRGPNPGECVGGQDDTFPEIYARAYHDAYTFIKRRDPTARISVAGLVEVTPGRLQYWDKVWQAYQQTYGERIPVDVWNMHLYVLPELVPDGNSPSGSATVALGTDMALGIRASGNSAATCSDPQVYCWAEHDSLAVFGQQIAAMRTWMKQRGEQNKPLILAEYSQLYPFVEYDDPINPTTCYLQDEYGKCWTQARVQEFMLRTFDYLETAVDPNLGYPRDQNRLVQRWLWFTMNIQPAEAVGYVSNLLTNDLSALTGVGETYRTYVAGRPQYINLQPEHVAGSPSFLPGTDTTGSAAIHAEVVNIGNVQTAAPFGVTFYADSALTQPIGSVQLQSAVAGCMSQAPTATVMWSGLALGTHQFWVKVDSSNALNESDESDNIGTGFVTIYRHGIMLPLIRNGNN